MKFWELMALVWGLVGLAVPLTWLILRHRREQARIALEARPRNEITKND